MTAKSEQFPQWWMSAHLGRETMHAAREALVRHWARVAHQALYRLRVDERQAHLHLHQRVHLLQL